MCSVNNCESPEGDIIQPDDQRSTYPTCTLLIEKRFEEHIEDETTNSRDNSILATKHKLDNPTWYSKANQHLKVFERPQHPIL